MELIPLKSKRLLSGSDLLQSVQAALVLNHERLSDKDVLVIASKALAYSQGRLVKIKDKKAFRELIRKEADKVLDEGEMVLTMKNKVLIPNAGIDNSNTPEGEVVLWPEKPFPSADEIRRKFIKTYALKNLGILISDSHCQPLRSGTSGIAIAWAGFEGVQDERGTKDLFGKAMQYTRIAMADDLASAANVLMGETDASVPFVIIRKAPVRFTEKKFSAKDYFLTPEECLYRPLYREL